MNHIVVPLKEILISFSIFLSCIVLAVASQIISPTKINATQINSTITSEIKSVENSQPIVNPFELDPTEINPSLFIMATEKTNSNESPLGSPLESKPQTLTASGLKITDLIEGDGAEAMSGDKISVNYQGTLENGTEFDSSYGRAPFSFSLGNGSVIKGWDEGVQGMKVGGKRKLIIPPEMGYGKRGIGPIPPNATLIFEVELLEVN